MTSNYLLDTKTLLFSTACLPYRPCYFIFYVLVSICPFCLLTHPSAFTLDTAKINNVIDKVEIVKFLVNKRWRMNMSTSFLWFCSYIHLYGITRIHTHSLPHEYAIFVVRIMTPLPLKKPRLFMSRKRKICRILLINICSKLKNLFDVI